MFTYIFRRILLMFPTLIGITLVVFSVMALSPGGISPSNLIEGNLNPIERQALIEYYNKRYGLDKPAPVQYLRWLNNISPIGFKANEKGELASFSFTKGADLGTSFHYGRGVGEILTERLPITILLNVLTIPLIYILALVVGIRSATNQGGRFDVYSNITMLGLWSLPTMLVGVLLLGFFANIQHWQWFPTAGLHSRNAIEQTFLPSNFSFLQITVLAIAIFFAFFMSFLIGRYGQKIFIRTINFFLSILIVLGVGIAHASAPIILWILLILIAVILFWGFNLIQNRNWLIVLYCLIFLSLVLIVFGKYYRGNITNGYLFDTLWHLVLPVICMSYGGFAGLAKLTRAVVLDNLRADYVRTAYAKGLDKEYVLYKHIFRNSLLPLITVTAGLLPSLMAGSLIVENIFSINGMGQLAVEAVKNRDRELVLSITWISGFLTLVGYLIADFCYTIADPRVNYD